MTQAKILLADDSATIRTQIRRSLSQAGFEVNEAVNGIAAVRLAGTEPPSLAILDIDMPYLDGFGVCQQLKHMGPPWNEIPIVFLTASRSHALELLGERLGAYVQKPVSEEVIVEIVRGLMSKKLAPQPAASGGSSQDAPRLQS